MNSPDNSYLDANTFGIGQLIRQRRMFEVPRHQRNFAWEDINVETLFVDITYALERNDINYFIGTIVLIGPENKSWKILDGQQRIATVTLFFTAIRNWLSINNFSADANQIDSEFINTRILGSKIKPRLSLNLVNKELFDRLVNHNFSNEQLDGLLSDTPRNSSNYLLLKAYKKCNELIVEYANSDGNNIQTKSSKLFQLAEYLESDVKVVAVEVGSEANAFTIFESLNARGNDLSILDLVKNYIYGNCSSEDQQLINTLWTQIASRIEEKNADDFLKVFWTSRFGRGYKSQLYKLIKEQYSDKKGVLELINQLNTASYNYLALDDPAHEIWEEFNNNCAEKVEIINILRSSQVKAPILSAISSFDVRMMETLLDKLITIVIRYQIVGKRRTGAIELNLSRLASSIYKGVINDENTLVQHLSAIYPSDEEFERDFLKYKETKRSRVLYILSELDKKYEPDYIFESFQDTPFSELSRNVIIEHIIPKEFLNNSSTTESFDKYELQEKIDYLGNQCLLEKKINTSNDEDRSLQIRYGDSHFSLTNYLANFNKWGLLEIDKRQKILANLAVKTWKM